MSPTLKRAALHLRRVDPVLARIIVRAGPCRLRADRSGSRFSSLAEAILYQQITGQAAATIHKRLLKLAGGSLRPTRLLALSRRELRGAGLSRQKATYLKDLSRRVKSGLPLRRIHTFPDESVVETLQEVKGIGRWTAHMFLIFRLGRLDVLPVDDYGVRKAMQRAYGLRLLPKPKKMATIAEVWRPYRSVASWYLWRSLEEPKA
jgi:3-methyladenine DNA glycosylase/8-oxoguanine DNA glycosylase